MTYQGPCGQRPTPEMERGNTFVKNISRLELSVLNISHLEVSVFGFEARYVLDKSVASINFRWRT